MNERVIDITIDDSVACPPSRRLLESAAVLALDTALPGRSCQLSLALCSDDTVRELNHRYRGEDQVTDVLSFSNSFPGPWQGAGAEPAPAPGDEEDFPSPPGQLMDVGEIIISHPQAARQAAEAGHGVDRESALLVVHGVLHLLGHDHQEAEERSAMWRLQDAVMGRLFDNGPQAHSS